MQQCAARCCDEPPCRSFQGHAQQLKHGVAQQESVAAREEAERAAAQQALEEAAAAEAEAVAAKEAEAAAAAAEAEAAAATATDSDTGPSSGFDLSRSNEARTSSAALL